MNDKEHGHRSHWICARGMGTSENQLEDLMVADKDYNEQSERQKIRLICDGYGGYWSRWWG